MKKIILAFIALLTLAGGANAQLGSLSSDLVFTPVTPCRILDTRNAGSKSGILTAGSARGFWGWNTNFGAQGGSATSCGTLETPATAAILVNFTVVTPATSGYITAYPADVADANKPLAATVNFTAGSVIGNNATVKLNQTGTGDDFKIYTTSNVHVVADIVGFYIKPKATALNCVTVSGENTTISAGSTGANALSPSCPANYTYMSSNCSTNNFGVVLAGWNSAYCNFKNPTANAITTSHDIRCCQLPGR